MAHRHSFPVARAGGFFETLLQTMTQTLPEKPTPKVPSRRLSMVRSIIPLNSPLALTSSTDGSPTSYSRNTNGLGTTGQPAVVYVPAGIYILDTPLQLYVGTVLMGNPLSPPVLKAGYD